LGRRRQTCAARGEEDELQLSLPGKGKDWAQNIHHYLTRHDGSMQAGGSAAPAESFGELVEDAAFDKKSGAPLNAAAREIVMRREANALAGVLKNLDTGETARFNLAEAAWKGPGVDEGVKAALELKARTDALSDAERAASGGTGGKTMSAARRRRMLDKRGARRADDRSEGADYYAYRLSHVDGESGGGGESGDGGTTDEEGSEGEGGGGGASWELRLRRALAAAAARTTSMRTTRHRHKLVVAEAAGEEEEVVVVSRPC
jgi:hypothetical protein